MTLDADEVAGWIFGGVLSAIVLVGLIWCITALIQTTTADGGVDFCLVEYQPPLYRVMLHRPWRPDGMLALAQTFEEAVRAADAVKCPIGKP